MMFNAIRRNSDCQSSYPTEAVGGGGGTRPISFPIPYVPDPKHNILNSNDPVTSFASNAKYFCSRRIHTIFHLTRQSVKVNDTETYTAV